MEMNRNTFIDLTAVELKLALKIIKDRERKMAGVRPTAHRTLISKVIFAFLSRRALGTIARYSDAEKQLFREYNQEYCEDLSDSLHNACEAEEARIMNEFVIATALQFHFSPRH